MNSISSVAGALEAPNLQLFLLTSISMKHMQALTGRKRVPEETVRKIAEELFELGFVLIDLEIFYVVLAQRTFSSYRRVGDAALTTVTAYWLPLRFPWPAQSSDVSSPLVPVSMTVPSALWASVPKPVTTSIVARVVPCSSTVSRLSIGASLPAISVTAADILSAFSVVSMKLACMPP